MRQTYAVEEMVGRSRLGRGLFLAVGLVAGGLSGGCQSLATKNDLSAERRIADAMFAVLAADRAVYTREVVDRLQNQDKVLQASEHFRDEKKLPLPAQMLRMGAEELRKKHRDLSIGLVSEWPINRQNAARNDLERAGLRAIIEHPDQSFTAEETLGPDKYFTAIYADRAISPACVSCHNAHENSTRRDFKLGDVMGGVVIRIVRR